VTTDPTATMLAEPHRRYNPLTREWVLVSTGRTKRPWLGRAEATARPTRPAFDPGCYLCPGNARANGAVNPRYEATFIFDNDFAALRPGTPEWAFEDGLLRAEAELGTCRVICFSPRHDLDLGHMTPAEARRVVDVWATQTDELGRRYRWVQVFENRGELMGASNPHPHGQIWAASSIPREPAREDAAQRDHHSRTGRSLLLDYAAQDGDGPRVVHATADWLVVVPFWATWPFETLVIPRRPTARLTDLDDARRDDLASILTGLVSGYDGLFDIAFPYSMGWHQAPFVPGPADHWQLHAHFYPPLLGATVRKFMVGYELLSEPQRDISAEDAAERLREAAVPTMPEASSV
jgi:UDPglucose--hexose-1-phosphate uridylyltransferase